MKLKPSGAWYLVPIGILLLSFILAVYFFFRGVMSPLLDTTIIEANQSFTVELSEGSFVSLFIEDEDMTDYEIEEFDGYFVLTYTTNSDTHSVQIEIINDTSMNEYYGFDFEEFDKSTAFTIDQMINFADINISSPGTYIITISTYNDIPATFAYSAIDFDGDVAFIFNSIGIGLVGFIIALIGFIVIGIRRSNYKKILYQNYSYQNYQQPSNLNPEYNQNDYNYKEKKDDYDF